MQIPRKLENIISPDILNKKFNYTCLYIKLIYKFNLQVSENDRSEDNFLTLLSSTEQKCCALRLAEYMPSRTLIEAVVSDCLLTDEVFMAEHAILVSELAGSHLKMK